LQLSPSFTNEARASRFSERRFCGLPTAATELQRIEQRTKQMHQTNALLRKHQGSYATPRLPQKSLKPNGARIGR
jgi:hypothetical protein